MRTAARKWKRYFAMAGVKLLENEVHEIKGVGFAGVKGFRRRLRRQDARSFGKSPIKAFVQEAVDHPCVSSTP